jgi:hypothetical protein
MRCGQLLGVPGEHNGLDVCVVSTETFVATR